MPDQTPTPLTAEREQEIRDSIPTAYGPPWTVHPDMEADVWRVMYATDHPLAGLVAEVPDYGAHLAEFIATARAAVPELLAEIGRLRAEVATLSADRASVYREAARIADQLPTPDCAEMSSLTNSWEQGTYAVGEELRRLADEQQGERPEFTDDRTAWMQIGTTPSLQGLRAELRIDGYPPLVGRYAGSGMRKAKGHDDQMLIEPLLLFPHGPVSADEEQPAVGASEACAKCKRPFDPTDTAFDGQAQYAATPYCRGCVDLCHDNNSADHRCVICG